MNLGAKTVVTIIKPTRISCKDSSETPLHYIFRYKGMLWVSTKVFHKREGL